MPHHARYPATGAGSPSGPPAPEPVKRRSRLLGLGGPVRVVLDTDRLRRGRDKQKALWSEKLAEMKSVGIEYHPDWAAKAK